jgi:ribosome biogenesis GTPase
MDTPGFSSLSLFDMEKGELKDFYPEFAIYEDKCKFITCAHIHEPVCGVREALNEGKISRVRYDNYVTLYEELIDKEKRKY